MAYANASPALRIAHHEWGLVLKEPRFLLPFLVTPLLLVGLQASAVFLQPLGSVHETLRLARFLLLMLAVLTPSLAVPLSADSFAGERERNTLEILLCLPIRPGDLFWGKVLGIYPLPVLMGWMGQGAMLAVLAAKGMLLPSFWPEAIRALLLTPVLGLFLCALATLISLGAESVRGAAQLSSLVMLAVFFAVMSSAGALFDSAAAFAGALAALLLGAWICLLLGRRRFLRLPQ